MLVKSDPCKTFHLYTSWDDGFNEDLQLADLLRQYHLPAIFFIPSRKKQLTNYAIRDLAKDFDIGGHTVNHFILRPSHQDIISAEVYECKEDLESIIKRPVTNFCYPRGRYDDKVKQIVKEAGFLTGRTTDVLETDYSQAMADPYAMSTTVHAYQRTEYGKKPWHEIAKWLFDQCCDPFSDADYFHIWGHSWEITKYNYWGELEWLFDYMSKRIIHYPK